MKISFVIPAHDEETELPHTLRALHAAASTLDYEIIVADDASTDSTARIAAELGARVVSHQRRQIAATRNLGARAATGDVLIFVDADTRVHKPAVDAALAAIRAGATGGGCSVRFDGPVPLYARVTLAVLQLMFRLCKLTGGCFVFCTRAAFDKSGGWNESLYAGEEIDFALALKKLGRFVIVREGVVTSGRKLRTYAAREIFGVLAKGAFRGRKFVSDRANLDLWYAPRRADPWNHCEPHDQDRAPAP